MKTPIALVALLLASAAHAGTGSPTVIENGVTPSSGALQCIDTVVLRFFANNTVSEFFDGAFVTTGSPSNLVWQPQSPTLTVTVAGSPTTLLAPYSSFILTISGQMLLFVRASTW